MVVVSIRRTSP